MKNTILPTIALLTLGLAAPVFAQTYIDNFNDGIDGANWTQVPPTNVVLKEDTSNGDSYINFHTAGNTPEVMETFYLNHTGNSLQAPTNLQDFSVSLDASNYGRSLTATADSYAQIGLNINNIGLTKYFNLHNGAYSYNASGASDVQLFDGTNVARALNFEQSVTLLLGFSSATQTFTVSYATADSGSFSSFATLNIDGTGTAGDSDFVDNWSMASGESFDINIFATTNVLITDQSLGFGYLNADNFQLTIVPEASSYAALVGILALGATLSRRRRSQPLFHRI